jgi:hypothetical protein
MEFDKTAENLVKVMFFQIDTNAYWSSWLFLKLCAYYDSKNPHFNFKWQRYKLFWQIIFLLTNWNIRIFDFGFRYIDTNIPKSKYQYQ